MKKIFLLILAFSFVATMSFSLNADADVEDPNLLVEDYVKISCTPEFSITVFTGSALKQVTFYVRDAVSGAVLFGPKVVPEIKPFWQKVWLGPLSSIPPKIYVDMEAKKGGKRVTQRLILEPDCRRETIITERVKILWPKGNVLTNLIPPTTPPDTPRFFDIPLTVAVPKEAIGQDLIAVVVWKNPETGVQEYISAHKLTDIPTEILQLNLRSVWTIQISGHINPFPPSSFLDEGQTLPAPNRVEVPVSFFDVFIGVGVGKEMGPGLIQALEIGKLIADAMEKIGKGEVVTGRIDKVQVDPEDSIVLPSGQGIFLQSTFDEIEMSGPGDYIKTMITGVAMMDAEPLRVIDATPLLFLNQTAEERPLLQ